MLVKRVKAAIKNGGLGPRKTNTPGTYHGKNIRYCFVIDPTLWPLVKIQLSNIPVMWHSLRYRYILIKHLMLCKKEYVRYRKRKQEQQQKKSATILIGLAMCCQLMLSNVACHLEVFHQNWGLEMLHFRCIFQGCC